MRVHACSLTSIGGHPDDPRGHSFPRVPAPKPLASSHLTCTFWRSRGEDPPTPDPRSRARLRERIRFRRALRVDDRIVVALPGAVITLEAPARPCRPSPSPVDAVTPPW